mmetsp:Transcript_79530/g.233812  ORF Transcript_79530/g.233812 Transcript_79530/m.233812 type:complete len:277 (+) Transcript_79530:433-1263(+)
MRGEQLIGGARAGAYPGRQRDSHRALDPDLGAELLRVLRLAAGLLHLLLLFLHVPLLLAQRRVALRGRQPRAPRAEGHQGGRRGLHLLPAGARADAVGPGAPPGAPRHEALLVHLRALQRPAGPQPRHGVPLLPDGPALCADPRARAGEGRLPAALAAGERVLRGLRQEPRQEGGVEARGPREAPQGHGRGLHAARAGRLRPRHLRQRLAEVRGVCRRGLRAARARGPGLGADGGLLRRPHAQRRPAEAARAPLRLPRRGLPGPERLPRLVPGGAG